MRKEGSLTGRRRFVADDDGHGVLALQVEYSEFVQAYWEGTNFVQAHWTNKWRWAKREDITSAETVIDLHDLSNT